MSQATPASRGETAGPRQRRRLGFSTKVLLGLLLGVGLGLFFGEACGFMEVFGDAFIGLLQMAVLPYIVVALILNIGKLDFRMAKQLGLHALVVFGGLWGVGVLSLLVFPLCFPGKESGSFFSTSLVEPRQAFDFVQLYIPTNPFESMAFGVIPAVVLFCVGLGVCVMVLPDKGRFLENLEVLSKALSKLNAFVIKLTPAGVFAISCSAAGTLTIDEVGRLQAYLIVSTIMVAFLCLWVLPMLVAAITPLGYVEVVKASRDAVIAAFASGKVFVVLPLLAEAAEKLMDKHSPEPRRSDAAPGVLVPLAFPFPKLGSVVILVFVPFAAWFMGRAMEPTEYPKFLSAGVFSSFGNPIIIVPFLLDLMRLPADMFQLFVISTVVSDRVRNALNAMYLLVFTLITSSSLSGLLRLRPGKLATLLAGSALILAGTIVPTRAYLDSFFKGDLSEDGIIASMHLLHERVPAVALEEAAPNPDPLLQNESRLERIHRRGTIRVGFTPDHLPFAFKNRSDDLVGFDVDMAHRLAADLGVDLEFVPLASDRLAEQLEEDHCDLIMSGIAETVGRATAMELSTPYLDLTLAVVVPDYRRGEFESLEAMRRISGLKVAVFREGYFAELLAVQAPWIEVVEVDSYRDFFEGNAQGADALVASAEAGSAWTLLRPGFQVINPLERKISLPLVYPVGGGPDEPLQGFLEHWIDIKQKDGTTGWLYDYWILGLDPETSKERWCIARDVLGWME